MAHAGKTAVHAVVMEKHTCQAAMSTAQAAITQTHAAAHHEDNMKAQATIDFMISLGMALVLMTLVANATINQQNLANEIMVRQGADSILEELARDINSIYLAGNNATIQHTLPATMTGGIRYQMWAYPRSILLNYTYASHRRYSKMILPASINNTEMMGLNTGKIRITNNGGTIYFKDEL